MSATTTVPTVTPDQTARFSGADWSRVATLVASGVPRGHALAVVQQQRDARLAGRPAARVVSRSAKRERVTAVDRIDPRTGMEAIRPVADHAYRPYRVAGTTSVGSSALAVPTTDPVASRLRAVEAFRASGRPSALTVARAALGA